MQPLKYQPSDVKFISLSDSQIDKRVREIDEQIKVLEQERSIWMKVQDGRIEQNAALDFLVYGRAV
jgi:hypothetical protein